MKCDFCSSSRVAWGYPAENFVVVSIGGLGSDGGWAACGPCSELIEAKDWEALTRRAAEAAVKRSGGLLNFQEVSRTLRSLYAQFSEHRKGERVPL